MLQLRHWEVEEDRNRKDQECGVVCLHRVLVSGSTGVQIGAPRGNIFG